ncbi:MAG: hypothetical protein KDA24_07025 [Deltaproteobacteria bacterium]|nr:hypothetical protein [Deltaproteobacteria bacterium]
MQRTIASWPLSLLAVGVLLSATGCPTGGVSTPLNIDTVTLEQTVIQPGETIAIVASASGGEGLSYTWAAEAGELSAASAAETTWTAPEVAQLVRLDLTVADADDRSVSIGFDLVVGAGIDHDGDGYTVRQGDCDDTNSAVYPGAPDVQDGFDNDCDGELDEGSPESDDDGDGFADLEGDCDDADPAVYPDAPETINGIDDDCDGEADEGTEAFDDDGDGFSEQDGDCNDLTSAVSPSAPEVLDGLDNNCDGDVDEGTAGFDDDGDGFTELAGDCDDDDSASYPTATEVADGADNDCNGVVDDGPFMTDDDGDGWSELAGDCDDDDFYSFPGAPEWGDGQDNDCDGSVDEDMDTTDDDGDGQSEADGDCDDYVDSVYTGATELDDTPDFDNNCDGWFFVNAPFAAAVTGATSVACGDLVSLDGSGSWDPDSDTLEYYWFFSFQPINSGLETEDITGGTTDTAEFTPDVPGVWQIGLLVNDGMFNSTPAIITLDVTAGGGC